MSSVLNQLGDPLNLPQRIIVGDSWQFILNWVYLSDGTSRIEDGATFTFLIKPLNSADSEAILSAEASFNAPIGQIVVELLPTQTGTLPPGIYWWKLFVNDGAGNQDTLSSGPINVTYD